MSNTREIISKNIPLIKFQNKDKIEYLQKGRLYLKSLAYYRKRELETGDDTVGDMFEAMIHANDGYIIIPELGISAKLSDELINTSFGNTFAFCMFSPYENTDVFEFSDEQKEKLLEFGDSALLITDRYEFFKRVAIALDKEGIKGYHGYVNYYDETKDNFEYWQSLIKNGMTNVAFWKRERYSYQQEYRFLIEPPITENDYFELEIGSIADISVVLKSEQALTAIASRK